MFQRSLLVGQIFFGAPNCPVRALRYYHSYMSEHPELRKGRRCLFIPIKDNNAGKELISRWTCATIVDSHATLEKSRNLPKTVKAHEVCAVAISLQRYNKVDLKSVMKAGRCCSGGTFISFYLCPQADLICKAGPVVASGEVVVITSSPWIFYL